jgi:hypothetical protein
VQGKGWCEVYKTFEQICSGTGVFAKSSMLGGMKGGEQMTKSEIRKGASHLLFKIIAVISSFLSSA